MKSLMIIPLLFLCACQRGPQYKDMFFGIDSTFQPYYDAFGSHYGLVIKIPIAFVSQPTPKVGECMTYDNGHRQIEIDPAYWISADAPTREELIDHELGHCVFGRTHNHSYLADGCPASMMNPYVFGDPCFTNHKTDYLNELPYSQPGDYL